MANMSYCAFENTVSDLQQCIDLMDDHSSLEEFIESRSSDYERRAVKKMIDTAQEFLDRVDEIDDLDILDKN